MRVFRLLLMAVLVDVSRQSSWEELKDFSPRKALRFLNGGLSEASEDAIRPNMHRAPPAAPQPHPHAIDTHPQPEARPKRGPKPRLRLEPGLLPEPISSSRTPPGPVVFERLPAPPAPLALSEKYDILNQVAARITSRGSHGETELLHPFLGPALPPAVLNEFGVSRSLLREIMPGHFVQTRGHFVSTRLPKHKAQRGDLGLALERHMDRHLFVFKQAPLRETQRPRTVLSFVGMIELKKRAQDSLRGLRAYRTTKVLVTPIGPDSFVDHSALVPVDVPRPSQRRQG